jgi:meso-butanediol dehydrogenase / (S,S)-butanediol dehydrogenase / diacetyl reductase
MSDSPVVVITGGASGIGRAAVELFAARSWNVVCVDRTSADDMASGSVVTLAGDIASEDTNAAMVATAVERFGRLDAAILNAGVTGTLPWTADGAVERFEQTMSINVTGVVLGIRHCAPALVDGGSIIVTSSTSGMRADPNNWAYNASKGAVINLVRAAAVDLGPRLRVNAVAPGPTWSGLTERLGKVPPLQAEMASRMPLKRFGEPHEIAEAMFFLASPAASFITGVNLPVDGGHTASAAHFPLP